MERARGKMACRGRRGRGRRGLTRREEGYDNG